MKKSLIFIILCNVIFAACASPVTPTPVEPNLRSVETVEAFYMLVNNAQTEDDIKEAWNMLADNEQCNARYKCQYPIFQKLWWQWKTDYKLYDCGDNQVYAEVVRYPGDGNPSTDSAKTQSWMIKLVEMENNMMIDTTTLTQSNGDGCVLLREGTATP